MSAESDFLDTALLNLAQEIAAALANKPTYSKAGQSVQWDSHYKNLLDRQALLRVQRQQSDGAFEILSVG